MIKTGGATIHPTTENLFSSTQFNLQVTSDKGCVNSDQVTVSVQGTLLGVQCSVNPDTICNDGSSANLLAIGSGGGGTYTYQWASIPGTFNSTLANPVVSPTITTDYTVTVTDGFTSVACQTTLVVKPLPQSHFITGGGKYCAGGSGVPIGLASSSVLDTYVLKDQSGITVGNMTGTGGPVTFGTYTTPGIYRATATSIDVPHCSSPMTDTAVVEIIPLPTAFPLTGGGSFSAGGVGVSVGLAGSELGVEYELWINGTTPVIPRRPGTGFGINFGNQTTAGFYTVIAYTLTTPVCTAEMMDTVEVIINPWPVQFSVTGGGEYCTGGVGVPVGLSGSEIGVKYYLRIGTGTVLDSLPGTGDVLDFGLQTLGGIYTVKGVNTTSGLSMMMTGQAEVIVNPLPLPYLMVPQGDTCYGTELLLNGSQAGVEYYLLKGNDTVKMVIGNGMFGLLTFGHVFDTGTLRSVAHNPVTGCWNDMIGTVTLQPAPLVFQLLPPGILCPGQEIWLTGSQSGILYQLRRDSLVNVGSPVPGTGAMLNFGPQYLPGKYRVIATNPVTHCYSWMEGDATIQPSPTVYNILPSGDTCAPAIVRLNGSQTGMSYRLVFNNTVYLDSLYGTGQPLVFGTYSTAGLYRIRAIDTLTHCEYWMDDSLRIAASPVKYNIIPNGIACAGMEVGLDGSEAGVDYSLIRDGWILAGGPIPGTGAPITFGAQSTPGTYTVTATRTLTGCDAVMNGSAQLSPLPVVYLITPQGNQCAGTEVWLNGSQLGVTYQLFRDSILQASLTGTGSMLNFGPQYLPGVYTIKAADNLSTCDTLMGGTVTILPGPLQFSVTPAGINCSPATIGLTGSELGVIYQLRRNSSVNVGAPLAGTGTALSFGSQTIPGYYSVVATDTLTDCYSRMPDSVFIQPPATVYNIVPSGDTCMGAIIRLNGSQPGKEYILVLNGSVYLDTIVGTGSAVVFGSYTTTGVYRVIARDLVAGCKTPMSDSLRILDSPVPYNIIPNGISCVGMEVGLDDSDPGVNYTLILEDTIIAAGPVAGTGGPVNFGVQTYAGNYTVVAVIGTTACSAVMNGASVLYPDPVSYVLFPQDSVCAGTDLYLNGSQSGVSYTLRRDNVPVLTLPGTGDIIHFGAQYLPGNYTVYAVYSATTCDTMMQGSTTILPMPLTYDVLPAGANCSPAEVGLSGSQTGVTYQLYRDGFATGTPVAGTGSALSFGLQPAGSYTVVAMNDVTLCRDTMPDTVTITNGPQVHAGGDTAVCAGHPIQLSATATDYSSVLWITLGDGIFSDPAILDPVYTPGNNDIAGGTVLLVIKGYGSAACPVAVDEDTLALTIDPQPLVDAGLSDTLCQNGTAPLNATAQHYSSVQWSTRGDGTFDNMQTLTPVYTPGDQDILTGSVWLDVAVHGTLTCSPDRVTDSLRLTLEPLPSANAGPDDTLCENGSYRLSGSAQHHSSVAWTTLGDGTFDNPALPDASYTPGMNDRTVGNVRLVLTALGESSCQAEWAKDTMRLVLNKLPLVNAGSDATICSNQDYPCNASVQRYSTVEWKSFGDGIFSNRYSVDPVYSPGSLDSLTGSVWLILEARGLLGCLNEKVSDSLQLTLYPMPVADAGPDTLTCPNVQVPLHGTGTHYTSVLWNTLGNGIFSDPAIMAPLYSPGSADIQAGYADLVMTLNGEAQCSPMIDSDTVRLTFKPLPTISVSGSALICEGETGTVVFALGGLPPWSVTYTDGLTNYAINNIPSSPYTLVVTPIATTTYTALSVSDGNCSVAMTGPSFTVSVNPQPDSFNMTVTNGGGYCEGGTGVEIGIDGSQTGIFYQLLFAGQPLGFPMPGTGQPLSFGWKTQPGIYQVLARHPQTLCETQFSDSVIVIVFPTPRVDFTSDSSCYNLPTQFHLTGPDISRVAVWEWDFGDGNTVSYTAPIEPMHLYPATGSYQVTLVVTDTNGCVKTLSHRVYVNELPVALFSHNAPMCSGNEVHFTDYSYSPGNNYLDQWHWEFGDNTDTTVMFPDLPDVSHLYLLPGTYDVTLTVTTHRGCSASRVRPVVVSPAPVADFAFTNPCEQENVQFSDISQLQGGGAIVEWNWNFGDPMSGVNNTAITANPVHVFTAAGPYQVTLVIMNSGGCTDTIVKPLTVLATPRPDFSYNTACLGSVTQFSDITSPNTNIEWLWDFGDGSPASTSQNPSHIYANPGVYTVKLTVKNANFCSHDTTHSVTVIALPTAGFQTNAPQCKGLPVAFTNTSTTVHGQIVKWIWDFNDGTDTTIVYPGIPNVVHTFQGTVMQHTVRLTVVTSDSCTSYVEHVVQSVPGPMASFDFSTTLCPGENIQFTDLSQLNGGGPITLWRWSFGDPTSGSSNVSTLQHPAHAFTGAGPFQVKMVISNAGNCKDSLTRQVTISAPPVPAFTFDTVCLGSVTHFTNLSSTLTGSIVMYDWDFGDGQPHGNTANPAHLYVTAGPFTVTLRVTNSAMCTSTVSRLVRVNPPPVALFTGSSVNCSGLAVSFTDQSTAQHGYILEWAWDFGDGHDTVVHLPAISPVNHIYTNGGTYTVTLTVKTSDSCTATTSNPVTVNSPPLANFSYSAATCQGAPVQFTDLSQPNGGGAINNWYWDFGDPLSGVNNQSTLQNPVHNYIGTGPATVRLIVRNAYQCSDTMTKSLTVSANPVAVFTADTACKGSPTHFTDNSQPNGGTISSWTWDFGDGSLPVTGQTQTHTYTNSGTYLVTLTVVTTAGCQHDTTRQVLVNPVPNADFTYTGYCQGSPTQFNDLSTMIAGTITDWLWDFDDGGSSILQNPSHTFSTAGTFMVKLTVTSQSGCRDSITLPVSTHPSPQAAFSYYSVNCPAGKVTFTDQSFASGSPLTSWNWILAPGSYSTLPNPVYVYPVTGTNQLISMIVTDGNGCSDTIDSTIYIKPGFAFTFDATTPCLGTATQFTPVNLAPGDTLKYLQWTFGEPSSGSNNYSNAYAPTHAYATAQTYTVRLRAYNSDNCQDSVFKEVTVNPLPSVDISTDAGTHCDSVVTLTQAVSGNGSLADSLVLQFGDGTDTTFVPPIPPTVVHRYPAYGLYLAEATIYNHNGCQRTDSTDVNVACITASCVASDTLACQQKRVIFVDNSSPVNLIRSWKWSFGDGTPDTSYAVYCQNVSHRYQNAGPYVVTLIVEAMSNGFSVFDTTRITVPVRLSPVSSFSVEGVCQGDSSRFINLTDSNGTRIVLTQWRFADAGAAGHDTSTVFHPVYLYRTAGMHPVQLVTVNHLGCSDTLTSMARVYQPPRAAFTPPFACNRYDLRFVDQSTQGDTVLTHWWWNFSNPETLQDTISGEEVINRFEDPGSYLVSHSVRDGFGCQDTVSHVVEVLPSPVAAFTVTDEYGGKTGQVKLNNLSHDSIVSYWWTFAPGKTSKNKEPVFTYTEDGEHVITLVVKATNGCYDTTSMNYEFHFHKLFVPNAFSPVSLSSNLEVRVFKPKGLKLKTYHAMIFDKWGHLLWESTKLTDDGRGMPADHWDGTFNGQPMPQDVYMWKISATFEDGTIWEGSDMGKGSTTTMGTVTLIR